MFLKQLTKNKFIMAKSKVDQLVEELETVKNETLQEALKEHAEEQKLEQKRRLLKQFQKAKERLNHEVEILRDLRNAERAQKKEVEKVNKAFEQFKQDGDYEKFKSSIL